MQRLSEFVSFVSRKSGVRNVSLIESDVILHRVLSEIRSSELGEHYLFKGGSCMVKCFFGYYRFSLDLDFTWREQNVWKGLGKRGLRRELLSRIRSFGSLLEKVSKQVNLNFEAKLGDRNFIEFGGGGRMVTFKLWKGIELMKIQVNFVENILFKPKRVIAKTLLNDVGVSANEEAYFKEFLSFYRPFSVNVYDEREILCEKVRAILTRKAQKLRDFYDLYILDKHGFRVEDYKHEIIEKIKAALYYKKYREALVRNSRELAMRREILEDPFERSLFIVRPAKEFESFLKKFLVTLREIANKACKGLKK
ncbi:nucleotidyl transferase AbiEii/AbiGii toxin family protein [Candidatus Bathyarchaeota archaeon]|nr:nucleotidyl transferase AbiEii/AbiGii toxin family protein [Candidatus Bathyarchaeota archaeon]